MNECNDPDHGAINAERSESRGLRKAWIAADGKSQYLERQLTAVTKQRDEAREAADKWEKIAHDKLSEVCRQIEKTRFVTEQRDRLAEALKEIYNVSSFDYDTMPELARKKYREVVLEMADEALQSLTPNAKP